MKNFISALLVALLVLFTPLSSHAEETQPAPIGDPIPLPPIDGEFMPAPDGGDPIPLPPIDGEYMTAPVGDPIPIPPLEGEFEPAPAGDPIPLPPIDGEYEPAPVGDPIKLPPLNEKDLVAEFEKERQGSHESKPPTSTKTSAKAKSPVATATVTRKKASGKDDVGTSSTTKVGLPSTGN